MNLEELWQRIESGDTAEPDGQADQGVIRLAAGGPATGRVYAALERPGAGALMLLRVPRAAAIPITSLNGEVLELRWLWLDGPAGHAYLALSSRPGADRAMFAHVAQDIAEHVMATVGGEAAVGALTSRLDAWRAFLRVRGAGLSVLALRGLFGELWFIRQYLLTRMSGQDILSGWTGPGGAAQDFRFGRIRIEIKTTATADADIEISSAQQLVVLPGQRLLLAHLVLEGRPDGESIPELVASVLSVLTPHVEAVALLESRLLQMGYHTSDEHRYIEPRLWAAQSYLYEVCDDFPRLIPDMLPLGVNTVRYGINPGRCQAFIRNSAAALADLEGAQ